MKIMARLCRIVYGVAMFLMFICVGVAGALVLLGNWLEARIAMAQKKAARRGGALTGGRFSTSAEKPHSHYRESERKMSR